jgi:hypothetical protein
VGLATLKKSCNAQVKAIGGDQFLDLGEDLTRFADDPEGLIMYMQPNGMLSQDQREILRSYIEEQETNVQAAHGVGKTWLLAWIVIHFVKCLGGCCTYYCSNLSTSRDAALEVYTQQLRSQQEDHRG